jgi:Family of unknown function (DUF5712)
MPYLKFDRPQNLADNKGSCDKLVNYLEKEDKMKGLDKEFFFNHSDDCIPSFQVIEAIDNNKKGLMNTDAKFYSGSLNFSQKELAYLNNNIEKIKEYTVEVMKEYAWNFDKGLTIEDINWFAKLEHNRYYHGSDKKVKNGIAKQGEEKPGLNTHIHFIIGRKSADGKKKLSPASNHRNTKKGPVTGGFNRDRFKNNCELIFDKHFLYNRSIQESYYALKVRKNGTLKDKQNFADKLRSNDTKVTAFLIQNPQDRHNIISRYIDQINSKLNGESLVKNDILSVGEIPYMSSAIYKSLINLSANLNSGKTIVQPTQIVLNYAQFINRKIKDLPAELREDKIRRACYELHTGQEGKKWNVNVPKVMEYEQTKSFSGKLINDIIDVTTKLNSNNDLSINSPLNYLFKHNYISNASNPDDEEMKRRKKKKKLKRNDDYSR